MRYFAIVAIGLTGCATTQEMAADVRTTHLVCGATRLDISHDHRLAVVRTSEGAEITLQRSDTRFGTRYEAQGVSVLRSGDAYILTDRAGTTTSCSLLQR